MRDRQEAAVILRIKVKPNSRAASLAPAEEGWWVARVTAPPVDGRANEELIGLVAEHFGCPRSLVTVKSGGSGRTKLVTVRS